MYAELWGSRYARLVDGAPGDERKMAAALVALVNDASTSMCEVVACGEHMCKQCLHTPSPQKVASLLRKQKIKRRDVCALQVSTWQHSTSSLETSCWQR